MQLLLIALLVANLERFSRAQNVLGEYPGISSLAAFRPVETSSVCGENGPEDYCLYTSNAGASLLPNCQRAQCDNTCPFSSRSPTPLGLAALSGNFGSGISGTQGRPGSSSQALRFQNSSISIPAARVPVISSNGFSFAVWINQDEGNQGGLIAKLASASDINYAISISSSNITLSYLQSSPNPSVMTATVDGLALDSNAWHHVTVTTYAEDAVFYVNGSVVGVMRLEGPIVDNPSRDITLGQIATFASSYNGLMQDIYYYTQALTMREVVELVAGTLPFLHLSTECHCPPSHPLVNPQNPSSCTQHPGGNLIPRGTVGRLNSLSHAAGYLNDFSGLVDWVSSPGVRNVNITINLTNSLYEIFLVTIRYGSPRPRAAVLETSRDGGVTYRPVQYFADDCMMYFGLPDNGAILAADDVNCITATSSQSPTFNGNVRFRFIDQSTRNFDLNTSPEFRNFILASHLRLRLIDYFTESTSLQHRYYSIQELAVAARCACNGHASRCDGGIDAVCQCVHNTEGRNCERCLPTHNDKGWRYGTSTNGFPCKPCRCNNHATTCIYNATVDPFPNSYELGGGGVCQDCQNNTAGINCETCGFGFFRPTELLPTDPTPCEPCMCNAAGITDRGDCVKDQGTGGQIIGQCFCKANVLGLKCDVCRPGFSNLTADNPAGCTACGCNIAGTFNAMDTCNAEDGQCLCKGNVEGLKCDRCRPGTTSLSIDNPLGCEGCVCDSIGSVLTQCDPVTGSCICKPGVTGPRCDMCISGFSNLSNTGCVECSCNPEGSTSNVCDPLTGRCPCLPNVNGTRCDMCAAGFYDLSSGCSSCGCNTAGTVGGDESCNLTTGQCNCKSNVQGRICDTCNSGFTDLLQSNPDGCSVCNCFSPNTNASGMVCDPITSQCVCLPSATGLRCESCVDGFYMTSSGCVPCGCNLDGSNSSVCHKTTGNCPCQSAGVTGRTCDTCLPGLFQFPSCFSCGCDPAGAMEGTLCSQETGVCSCKQFVTGSSCDQCIPGFQNLEISNPFGCSAPPDELAPPTLLSLSSSSILLSWLLPEVSNGFIRGYIVYQDNRQIANISQLNFTVQGLQPNTNYSFAVEAYNSAGSTRSAIAVGRTQEGVPSGITAPILRALDAFSVQASWSPPTVQNGAISQYELAIVMLGPEDVVISETVVFTGAALSTVVPNLQPFTFYNFIVRACTSSGCGSSPPSLVQTLEAPPTFQTRPNVTMLTAMSLLIEWEEPQEPNGIIIRYEISQREAPFEGDGIGIGNTSRGVLSFMATGLQPFTLYEFSVTSFTSGGGTQSLWNSGRTGEAAPAAVQPPNLLALSSSQIQVSWSEPLIPNGVISLYTVFQINGGMEVQITSSPEPGNSTVQGLLPFTEYFFLLEACNVQGCTRSQAISTSTLEGVPSGQPPPVFNMTTSSSVFLNWNSPSQLNGVISSYSILRRPPSLLPSPLLRDVGISFDGNVIKQFLPADNLGGIRNTIMLSFRTFSLHGTILYYINTARTDYIAIELRNGVPWFFFDAGSGPAIVQPDLGGADLRFNDGAWHRIEVTQSSRTGSISIDGMYLGTGMSMGMDQVISSRQTLHVGGIPPALPRSTVVGLQFPNATLNGINFAGCIFGMTLNSQPLDFSEGANLGEGVISEIPGCSIQLQPGLSFLGGGYLSFSQNTLSSSSFSWSFDIRTNHNQGLVFFAYNANQSALGIEILNSLLYLNLFVDGSSQRIAVSNISICDGRWHTVLIDQSQNEVFLSVDGSGGSLFLPSTNIVFSSMVFYGGVPTGSPAYNLARSASLNVYAPFSGCTRLGTGGGLLVNGNAVPQIRPSAHSLVRFDGCHSSSSSTSSSPSCGSPWVSLSAGTSEEFNDTGLQPFSEYLYRVRADNSAGFTASEWLAAITDEAAPFGVGVVSLVSQTSFSLTISWTAPTIPNGLITRYEVALSPVRTVGLDTPTGGGVTVPLSVETPEMVLIATATGLQPATTYAVVLSASTARGQAEGTATQLTTSEAAPTGVQAPMILGVSSRGLTVTWSPPTVPNGVITLYSLFVGGEVLFTGPQNITTISGLQPFTEYTLFLQACTSVGCANGTSSVGQTRPDAPMGLAPPILTVLGPSSIFAQWQLPNDPNGVIMRYELRRLLDATDVPTFEILFNDLNLEMEFTITGLLPNTQYTFQLLAFNAGGSVSSSPVQALTLEDIPDEISPPMVGVATSMSLEVSWSSPGVPNGDIILYNLTLNGDVVFSTEQNLSFTITNLDPFTSYTLTIIACTLQGCGSSNRTTAMTSEAIPEGHMQPTISSISPYDITMVINPVAQPNGIVNYVLYVTGDFESLVTGELSSGRRTVFNQSVLPAQVLIEDLIPFSNYSLSLEVGNSAGTLQGPSFDLQTASTIPDGLLAPSLSLLDATTITVQWSPPTRPNGIILSYQLQVSGGTTPTNISQGLSTSAVLTNLIPFTLYRISVSVTNTEGTFTSPQANITTGETAPSGFDRVVLLEQGPRHLVLSWDPPAMTNGILVNYTVLQRGVVIAVTLPSALDYNVTGLLPFSSYNFSIMTCTAEGCVESPSLMASTLEDVPENLSAPFVSASIGQPVLIVWTPPLFPNGVILRYRIERMNPNGSLVTVDTIQGSESNLVVSDVSTDPFTLYLYRVIAENGAGSVASSYFDFLTPEAAPDGVLPPVLIALSSSIIQVSFVSPLSPHGNITLYTITRSTLSSLITRLHSFTPSTLPSSTGPGEYTFNDTGLLPFTNYSYTLRVCTGGGCTDSISSTEVTLEDTPTGVATPTTSAVDSDTILVTWVEPGMPNGVIQRYDVFQLSLGFASDGEGSEISCCEGYVRNESTLPEQCSRVTTVGGGVNSFLAQNLSSFSFYRYCIVATNNANSGFSPPSIPTQTSPASMPRLGPTLNATTTNSTSVFLQWSSLQVSDLLGPLAGYTLYARIAGTPELGDVIFQGSQMSFTATNLLASTEYVFTVEVSNGVGSALSNNASATTDEGIPSGLPAPDVNPVASDTLSLLIYEPLEPNGQIILYNIIIDSSLVANVSMSGMVLLDGLLPFTLYTIQLEACTRFGCTRSPLVAARTLESVPVGLGSPFVIVTGPNSVFITWSSPNQANGNITEYQILQRRDPSDTPTVIFSGLSFRFNVTDLQPFTSYSFQVVAQNGAGNVTSIPTTVTTLQAPPSPLAPPTVMVISATEVAVSWTPPQDINGILDGYQVYRNGVPILTELTTQLSLQERDLVPFTQYMYFVQVCASGGCVNSSTVIITTSEALPDIIFAPIVSNVSSRSLVLTWREPGLPNGVITEYILTLLDSNNTVVFRGQQFSASVSDLTPFTDYSFHLMVCNSVGCVTSNQTDTQTSEAIPEGLDVPRLRNLTSTSVAVEWAAPSAPNGNITNYILRRGNDSFPDISRIIFQGLTFSFNDMNLVADTLYFYTIEAVNGGGRVTSSPSYFRTVPDLAEGIQPPTLTVRGAREIAVGWSAPESPNGEISNYRLFMNNSLIFEGIRFSYTAGNLTPFTSYSFFVEVCNQAGCASSITVSARTEQALAMGVTAPTLVVLGPTAISVSWTPPTQPNGIITLYSVRRRLLNQPITELPQHAGPPNILSFPNSGLTPFTAYEYRLQVTNGAGSVFSEWVTAQTREDIPNGIGLPLFDPSEVFARNVTATWMAPTSPNGIVLRYALEYRLAVDPQRFGPGEVVLAEEVPANVTTATATDLLPVTTYELRVVAINSAGRGLGPFEVVTTSEDVPEGIQPIIVEQRTGFSLVLTWNPPRTPNGIVREYMLFLQGEIIYRDSTLTYTITRLQPFTSYNLQLAACTSAGCTLGSTQSVTTAETPPFGQRSPTLSILDSGNVLITWEVPAQPNGIITQYEVLRQLSTNSSTSVIFVTNDVLNRTYVDTNVRPAQTYQYSIRAFNSEGSVQSDFGAVTTPEGAPAGFSPAILTVISSSTIQVSWLPPSVPNGVIIEYEAFRTGGGAVNMSVFVDATSRGFDDRGLLPFTSYSYVIEACTAAACTLTQPVSGTTNEATPTGLPAPVLTALSDTMIFIMWSEPARPNGIITNYNITLLPSNINFVIRGDTTFSRNVSNLRPFTVYAVTLSACNSVGCVTNSSSIRTLEATPEFIGPPEVRTVNATTLNVTWAEPVIPNGVIILYELRRNGSLVFSGTDTTYLDTPLMPNTFYSYSIQAYTAVGAGMESTPLIIARTAPDTPEGVLPPSLRANSSSSIVASWVEPTTPNGVILRYILLLDGRSVFEGIGFEYEATGLEPFSSHDFQLVVCTTTCGNSSVVSSRTLEALPQGLPPPTLNEIPMNRSVRISWQAPSLPNGIITRYVLERRQTFSMAPPSNFVSVFGESSPFTFAFIDLDSSFLRPVMSYEYRVTGINGAGNTSATSSITLSEAPPEGVPPPTISEINATSVRVIVMGPNISNGVITSHRLFVNMTLVQEIIPPVREFTISNLSIFTLYEFTVETCTQAGCTRSESLAERTGEAPPTGLAPPVGVARGPQTIEISWRAPQQPNGVILRYSLWYRQACPSPVQPNLATLPACIQGELTLLSDNIPPTLQSYTMNGSGTNDPFPYSSYEFQVGVANREGSVNSTLSDPDTTTQQSAPEVISLIQFQQDFENRIISLDWSGTFRYNGILRYFDVRRNGILLVRNSGTATSLPQEPVGIRLEYVVTAYTEAGQVSANVTTQIEDVVTPPVPPTNATTDQVTSSTPQPTNTPFYEEPAFIVGMVVLGVAILFILCAICLCCVRPRGNKGVLPPEKSFQLDMDPLISMKKEQSKSPQPSPERDHTKASWSPGVDPYVAGEIPDIDEPGIFTPPSKKSYSPYKVESVKALEHDNRLSDYEISTVANPQQFVSAHDDFGSFKRQQQTTFEDTRV